MSPSALAPSRRRVVVVVGTGTDVGKTHVTSSLLAHARRSGVVARGYKPVATGVIGLCDDAEAHALASRAPYVPPTFVYERPVSPHLAAREEGRPISLQPIVEAADALAATCDVVLVETAGGLMSPLGDALTNADLVCALAPARVLLVAPDRIGVLHDVTATLLAAASAGVAITTVALSSPRQADASTGENAAELERLKRATVSGVFPWSGVDAADTGEVAAKVWGALMDARTPLPR